MKKLLSFFAIVCLIGIVSVKAQSSSDSAYVRNFNYRYLNVGNLPISIQDTLNSSHSNCKIIKDENNSYLRRGQWAKGYAINITSPTALNIKMLSGGWDCFLYLLDSSFSVVTYNDDYNGSDYGSRVVYALQPGQYFIIAASYDNDLSSINENYSLTINAINAVDYSGLNYTSRAFSTPFTDTLGSNSQILAEMSDQIQGNYAKGYTIQAPQCNMKVSIYGNNRSVVVLDNNYNSLPYYSGRGDSKVIPLPQAGTYRIVAYSTNDYETETSLSDTFAIAIDTISVCSYPTLNYRNINMGDTIIDSLVDMDPYILIPTSGSIGPRASRVGNLYHAKGYRIQTGANVNYFDNNMLSSTIQGGNYVILLDANFNEIARSYTYSYTGPGRLYTRVSPSTTYYLVVQSCSYYSGDTGSYSFYNRATSDIANTYYVDALNGSDGRNGLTPTTAIATIDTAMARGNGVARIYLTEDYHFDNILYAAQYLEIYPYQKNIKLIPDGPIHDDVFDNGQILVLGKEGDSLYLLMDSIDGSNFDNFIDDYDMVEINNLKVRNCKFEYYFFDANMLVVRNSEFINDTVMDDEMFYASKRLHFINTTISNNNFLSGGVFSTNNLTMENSTIANNRINSPFFFYSSTSEVNLISGSIRNNVVSGNGLSETASMLGCDTTNLGGLFLLFGATANWGAGFMMDLNSYVIMDSLSSIALSENINGPAVAQILPVNINMYVGSVSAGYTEGRRVLSGPANILASNYTRFVLAQPSDRAWYIHPDGTIHSYGVGIEQAEQAEVAVYPNPASDRIFVQLDGVEADEICVLDIYGKQVKRIAAAESTNTIGVQDLAKGLYFVQVRKDGAAVATKKLIKK